MGRWKGSPQGPYWDPNDTGPNQVDPPPGASPNGPQAPMGAPVANVGDIAGQFPGIPWQGPHQGPWMPQVVDNIPGYDPNKPPNVVQPGSMTGNGFPVGDGPQRQTKDPNAPGYDPGFAGYLGAGGLGSLGSLSGMTKTADPSMALGGWGKPSGGQTGTISSLMNGGNLAGTGSAFGALFGKR